MAPEHPFLFRGENRTVGSRQVQDRFAPDRLSYQTRILSATIKETVRQVLEEIKIQIPDVIIKRVFRVKTRTPTPYSIVRLYDSLKEYDRKRVN